MLTSSLTPGPNSIAMSFQNNTTNTIQSLQLSYRLNNLPVVSEPWSGTLLPGDTAAYTFSTPANITLPHQMDIQTWVQFSVPTLGNDPANDTAHKVICMTLAGTYDVGGGNEDIVTFTQAMRELRDCGQHGAVELHIFGFPQGGNLGGYTAQFADSSGLYPIKVTYGNAPLQDTVFISYVDRCKRMSFVGLTIWAQGPGQVSCDGGRFIRCEDILIDSCLVYDKAIAFRGTKNFTVTNSRFTGLFGVSTIDQVSSIPPLYENSGTGIISNNIFDVEFTGVCIDGDQRNVDFTIDNNITHDPWRGLDVRSQENLKSMVFSNNQIYNTTDCGICMGYYCQGCPNTNGVKIYNNMVTMVDTNIITTVTDIRGYSPMDVIHNSFIGYASFTGGYAYVLNNIFASNNYACVGPNIQASFNYNCYFPMDTAVDFAPSAPTYADLLTNYSGNTNSFAADPGFVSATDLHTNSLTVANRGYSLVPYLTDIDGDAWSSPPDVGADENGLSRTEEATNARLRVWPTCFVDELQLVWQGTIPMEMTHVKLMAMDGRLVAATAFEGADLLWKVPSLPAGCYALTATGADNRIVTVRVVKL